MNVKFFTKMREDRRPADFREISVYTKKRRKRSPPLKPRRERKIVMITGASTGLGLAIAKQLMSNSEYHLVLTARDSSLDRFSENGIFESDHISLRKLNVTKSLERRRLITEIDEKFGGVDILINNAGVALRSVAEHATEEDRVYQMQVNYIGPMRLISLVLPSMRRKQAGRIINVSSASGVVGMPTMACYTASKYALEGATESLWFEVNPWNIHVTLVIPGFICSDSYKRTRNTHRSEFALYNSDDAYNNLYLHMSTMIQRFMCFSIYTPERIAKNISLLLHNQDPPLRYMATLDANLFYFMKKLLPLRWFQKIVFLMLGGKRKWGRQRQSQRTQPAYSKDREEDSASSKKFAA